jgi:lysophospholipase L1-like esterase
MKRLAPRLFPFLALLAALIFHTAALSALAQAPAAVPPAKGAVSKWEKAIAAFEASDRTNPAPKNAILFIGSSSIRLWKTLAKDFPEHRVINRGFGGSQIADSVEFAERIVFPYEPRLIVMYAGGNDLNAKKSPEQVLADFKAFVEKTRAKLPKTRIAFISIAGNPARWAQIEQVRAANKLVADYCKAGDNLGYIDTHSQMLGADGQPLPDIFVADRLHMNEKGYLIWKRVVAPHLK